MVEINLKKKAESWIKDKPKTSEKMIRLTIDITPELHQKLKMKCVMERRTIAHLIRGLLEETLRE